MGGFGRSCDRGNGGVGLPRRDWSSETRLLARSGRQSLHTQVFIRCRYSRMVDYEIG